MKTSNLWHEAQRLTLSRVCVFVWVFLYIFPLFLSLRIDFFGGECSKSLRCRFLFRFTIYTIYEWVIDLVVDLVVDPCEFMKFHFLSIHRAANISINLRFQLHKLRFYFIFFFYLDRYISSYLITLCRLWRIRVPVDATDVVL